MQGIEALGGLGLFLLGMTIMTDGLRSLAGNSMRNALLAFTSTPTYAATTGAVSTAILQSSSATTIAVIGFVSAEMMAFPNALGVIFGANLGTTITGWMVALLGFKLKINVLVMPVIFIGALMKLFGSRKIADIGYALAGFSLIFIGLTHMQNSMSDMQSILLFENFPGDSLSSRLLLVLFGAVFTTITQSSSAGVAATLTAIYADIIVFEQAAALVIGMDIGTTTKAALATIGSSVDTKRTGYSHVIYNMLTAVIALGLIAPFVCISQVFFNNLTIANPEIALVAFHTCFNLVSLLLVLPFTHQFANMIKKLIHQDGGDINQGLEPSLLTTPNIALRAVNQSSNAHLQQLLENLLAILTGNKQPHHLGRLQHTLDECHSYLDNIHLSHDDSTNWQQLIALIHLLDHLQRLHERCEEDLDRARAANTWSQLEQEHSLIIQCINTMLQSIKNKHWKTSIVDCQKLTNLVEKNALMHREHVAVDIGTGDLAIPEGTELLQGVRWLRRVSHHLARISHHSNNVLMANAKNKHVA